MSLIGCSNCYKETGESYFQFKDPNKLSIAIKDTAHGAVRRKTFNERVETWQ